MAHPTQSPAEQIAIYRDSSRTIIEDALLTMFPVCQKLVGEQFLRALIADFMKDNQSVPQNYYHYGASLIPYIESFAPANELVYLSDIARLDLAWDYAFNNVASEPFDLSLLRSFIAQAEQLLFRLPASSSLIASKYPIDKIWQLCQAEQELTTDKMIALDSGGCKLIVWRQQMLVHIDALTEVDWQILSAIHQGLPLAQVCAKLAPANINVADYLPQLVQRGWLSDFIVVKSGFC